MFINRLIKFILILLLAAGEYPCRSQDILLDKELGMEAAIQVEISMAIIQATPPADLVKDVGNNVIRNVKQPFQFNFKLIDSETPNAFALPGGYIYITRGLLELTNSEDELAGVIGHEIVHVLERHSVAHIKKTILPSIMQIPGNVIGRVFNKGLGNLINTPVAITSQLFLASYSRNQESEADKIGVQLAANAGYDPSALSGILLHMAGAIESTTGEKESKRYFDNHPYTEKRVDRINKLSAGIEAKDRNPIVSTKVEFYSRLQDLLIGENPAHGVFRENIFLHPELDFYIEFPEKWVTFNTYQAVAAVNEDKNAMLVLNVLDTVLDTRLIAQQISDKLKKDNQLQPVEAEILSIHGNPGSFLFFKDPSFEQVDFVLVAWVQYGESTYQMIGLGTEVSEVDIRNAVFSFRKLSTEEKRSIRVIKLGFAEAKQDETLDEFNSRTGNYWDTGYTAIANGLDEKNKLSEGQFLKIAREETYWKDP
jgi:predicted Zn-dependent protease